MSCYRFLRAMLSSGSDGSCQAMAVEFVIVGSSCDWHGWRRSGHHDRCLRPPIGTQPGWP